MSESGENDRSVVVELDNVVEGVAKIGLEDDQGVFSSIEYPAFTNVLG